MFVATANTLDTISPPLLDRCEVIECSGYITDEKLAIAKRFLLPKQVIENGLGKDMVAVKDEALMKVVTDYTREVSYGYVLEDNSLLTDGSGWSPFAGARNRKALPYKSSRVLQFPG